jgi:hypothetical protein
VTTTMQRFTAKIESRERGRVLLVVPFDPVVVWGKRRRHYVRGTMNGTPFSGSLGVRGRDVFIPVSKELRRSASVNAGDTVDVEMELAEESLGDAAGEEMRSAEMSMPDDLARAFKSEPKAARFFAELSGFYRRTYVRHVTSAKRPVTRASRVAEVVRLLLEGKKQRSST